METNEESGNPVGRNPPRRRAAAVPDESCFVGAWDLYRIDEASAGHPVARLCIHTDGRHDLSGLSCDQGLVGHGSHVILRDGRLRGTASPHPRAYDVLEARFADGMIDLDVLDRSLPPDRVISFVGIRA